MQYAGTIIVIALSITLLLAIGLLVFGGGKFVYGIAHYYLHERKPSRRFQHAELGVFISDGDLWSCKVRRNGRDIRLLIGGTENAPSDRLLAQAQTILGGFAALEQRAVEFLRNKEPDAQAAKLEFYCLNITEEQPPDNFTIEYTDPRDDSRVWRVEFVAGEPKMTGFDD